MLSLFALKPLAADPVLFPLHVEGYRVVGPDGQLAWLRGANVNALVQYNPRYQEAEPVRAADFREMHALGLNVVRLALSLSRLEPAPGRISRPYLNTIARTVSWAAQSGVWVILDLHQDRYAASLFPGEADGFPPWMVQTMGLPTRPIYANITDPAVQGAFTAFWLNYRVHGHTMQSYYVFALRQLALTFRNCPAVAGYDVMNEPNPGLFPPSTFVGRVLFPFYDRAVQAIRQAGAHQPIFIEPDLVSAMVGYQAWPKPRWWHQGVVFEPHFYNGTYRGLGLAQAALHSHLATPLAKVNLTPWNGSISSLKLAYSAAARLARREGVPWLVGEFGNSPTARGNRWLADQVSLQNAFGVGGLLWLWKIRPQAYRWQLVGPDGGWQADPVRVAIMASPHPLVVGGRAVQSKFNPLTRRYHLQYSGRRAGGPTRIYLSSLTYPHGFRLRITPSTASISKQVEVWKYQESRIEATFLTIGPAAGRVSVTISAVSRQASR